MPKVTTIAEWRANKERCAEFDAILSHPLMRDFDMLLRELALPVVGPEVQVSSMAIPGDAIRDYGMRHMYLAGQASVIKLFALLRSHDPAMDRSEPPPEWLPDELHHESQPQP